MYKDLLKEMPLVIHVWNELACDQTCEADWQKQDLKGWVLCFIFLDYKFDSADFCFFSSSSFAIHLPSFLFLRWFPCLTLYEYYITHV